MVILGLGSNKGDRLAYLRQATALLGRVLDESRVSRVYEARALLPAGAPREWDMPFLNMAIIGQTRLTSHELLVATQAVEKEMGRVPSGHWGPREIDIDILVMGDLQLDTPELTIPHKELPNRDFALLPLVELAPDWRYPVPGHYYQYTASDIARARRFACGSLEKEGIALYA